MQEQVTQARQYLQEGKHYIDSLDVLRAKLAGIWYCARFERILIAIERDGYRLRRGYPERRCLVAWTEMIGLGLTVALEHVAGRIQHVIPSIARPPANSGSLGIALVRK